MKSEKLVELQPTYAANGNFWKTYGGCRFEVMYF
jgi:hypothetical protein